MFGPVLENECCRRGKNSEIYRTYDEYNVKFIKCGRFRWAGHVMRMEGSDLRRKSFVPNQEELDGEKEADQSQHGATS
jgi:hypothetical protein